MPAPLQVDTEGIYGSSTFCLAVVERRLWRMHTACLGDSGIMVIGSTSEDPEARPPPHADPTLPPPSGPPSCCSFLTSSV